MTMPASAKGLGGRLPSDLERETANQLRSLLALQASGEANLRVLDDDGKVVDVTLAPAVSKLLMEVLHPIGRGDAVTLVPVSQMLTTQQAADILNVSRPFLISILKKGEIPFDPVGRHRRIRAEDLFAYKAARDKRRNEALSELAALDGELL
ncbi:helix-turn-helix domain-containing protein [Methylobacterium sp. GC_Met_2]|uniref:helix-turn-helix domain-containing protein n=1 Tax=Methylobacterium sp. GC_Met_2 TaxID=2937376 RepID=UPI00226B816C|nr:helix-turn-helix domain-containing protein [Methylobacterium sp. GC_Met_2]